jgi:hypothetical protein
MTAIPEGNHHQEQQEHETHTPVNDNSSVLKSQDMDASQENELPSPPPEKSIMEKFIELRGFPADHVRAKRLWLSYSKHIHEERINQLRRKMRIPDDEFENSPDIYASKKKEKEFIKIHQDTTDIGVVFDALTRRMNFERQCFDRKVCDMMENRTWYIQNIRQLAPNDYDAIMEKNQQEKLELEHAQRQQLQAERLRRRNSRLRQIQIYSAVDKKD